MSLIDDNGKAVDNIITSNEEYITDDRGRTSGEVYFEGQLLGDITIEDEGQYVSFNTS